MAEVTELEKKKNGRPCGGRGHLDSFSDFWGMGLIVSSPVQRSIIQLRKVAIGARLELFFCPWTGAMGARLQREKDSLALGVRQLRQLSLSMSPSLRFSPFSFMVYSYQIWVLTPRCRQNWFLPPCIMRAFFLLHLWIIMVKDRHMFRGILGMHWHPFSCFFVSLLYFLTD